VSEVEEDTQGVEVKLSGSGPWRLNRLPYAATVAQVDDDDDHGCLGGEAQAAVSGAAGGVNVSGDEVTVGGSGIGDDVLILHTPGHTRGHLCLLYTPDRVLFTGDHLAGPYPHNTQGLGELTLTDEFVKYDLGQQGASMELLMQHDWTLVLPGHGRPVRFSDDSHRVRAVQEMLRRYAQ
jgi:glyoxylase-like metal-dependent hydrolase (beta-lactamase superfamily II)